MPRKLNLDRPVALTLKLPESVRARLDLLLFSALEGRVPKGAYQDFFAARIQEFFEHRRLELTPYGFPSGYYISAPKEMLRELEFRLKKGSY